MDQSVAGPLQFLWDRAPEAFIDNGTVVQDDRERRERVLVAIGSGAYSPLAETALFRILAGLDGSEESILSFARQYGRLTGLAPNTKITLSAEGLRRWSETYPGLEPTQNLFSIGEPLSIWRDQILLLRTACFVWDCIHRRELHKLSRFFRYTEKAVKFELFWEDQTPTTSPRSTTNEGQAWYLHATLSPLVIGRLWGWNGSALERRFRERDGEEYIEAAALYWLAYTMELQQREAGGVVPILAVQKTSLARAFIPHNLKAAVWLQLWLEITKQEEWRQCQNLACRRWFTLAGSDEDDRRQRADKRYCSEQCRKNAWARKYYRTKRE